jgi:hypothetical protein
MCGDEDNQFVSEKSYANRGKRPLPLANKPAMLSHATKIISARDLQWTISFVVSQTYEHILHRDLQLAQSGD